MREDTPKIDKDGRLCGVQVGTIDVSHCVYCKPHANDDSRVADKYGISISIKKNPYSYSAGQSFFPEVRISTLQSSST